jgi:hypothetical protein
MLALTHADEKANANSALKNIRKIHLTRYSLCTLLFRCRAAAIAFTPSSPISLHLCKTHVGPHTRRANAHSALKNIRKIHLTRSSVCTLLFCCRAAAIAFAPSSRMKVLTCKTHVDPHTRRRKSKRSFGTEKHPKNSSYKVQRLHAAVLLQSGSNRLRSLVADEVVDLQNSCWPSHTPTKKQTLIRH